MHILHNARDILGLTTANSLSRNLNVHIVYVSVPLLFVREIEKIFSYKIVPKRRENVQKTYNYRQIRCRSVVLLN